ncbi:MAG: TraB/GumN family protein [Terricaulis sp.]
MLRSLLAAALLALMSASACADTQTNNRVSPALFVMRDADSTIYLYGTIHVRPAGADWGGVNAHTALAAASDVWTEIEISPETDARGVQLATQMGQAPADKPLSSWLTPAQNAKLAALQQQLGIPPGALETMQPWRASLVLSFLPIVRAGYNPESGVDRSIDAYGDVHGKHMRAFETIDQQLGFLSGLSPELQRQMLLESIDEADEGPRMIAEMTRAWEHADLAALERDVVADTRNEYPQLYDVMFKQRNARWIEVLSHEMQGSGTEFVAVGAGHLLGRDGLVAQLRARGFNVQRVPGP